MRKLTIEAIELEFKQYGIFVSIKYKEIDKVCYLNNSNVSKSKKSLISDGRGLTAYQRACKAINLLYNNELEFDFKVD